MASMREHLASMHKKMAEHHTASANFHATAASHFQKLAGHFKKADVDAENSAKTDLETLSHLHAQQGAQHSAMSEFHSDCGDKCMKGATDELSKLVPTNIRGTIPSHPEHTLVPRHGQRTTSSLPVDSQFQKLFSVPGIDDSDLLTQ